MAKELFKEAFQYAMKELEKEFKEKNNEDEFSLWFNMKYVEDSIDTITVSVVSDFMNTMITSKGYFDLLQKKLKQITGQNLKIKCLVDKENKEKTIDDIPEKQAVAKETKQEAINKNKAEAGETPKAKKHSLLLETFTFDTFIPGDNSNFAYKASMAVAKNPGKLYNPILIYGGSGLGKTHLMQAIGNYIYSNGDDKLKIYYGSAESFTNEFTNSLTSKKTTQFINKFRNLDVLLLDDIHFLDNKKGIQEELFHTFNALHEKQAQMVFTCDRPIKEIKNMTDRLVSRLSNGLCIDITIPNYETRVAILKKKLEMTGKTLDAEIIDYIAKNVETNVRELEAALKQILAYADIIEQEPTLEMAKNQLKDILNSNSAQNISLDMTFL